MKRILILLVAATLLCAFGATAQIGRIDPPAVTTKILTVNNIFDLTPVSQILANTGTITCAAPVVKLTSATSVTTATNTAIQAGTRPGQLLIVVNANTANTITVKKGTITATLSADVTLKANDNAILIWLNGIWIPLAATVTP